MAPEVVVPANFGKHHLKSRSHSNLELLCDEGEIKRANSMILSLNSSVIDDLISRLDITSLDVQDFGAPAVGCFVESMYSGELEKCDKSNFRDLHKMGYVFNVSWFTERCLEYFTEHVDMLTGRCYEDVLFVVEEARFVEESQKKDNFTSLVEDKLNTMRNRKSMFLKQYANDLDSISMSQLKMVIKLAGEDVGILVPILVAHLQNVGACSLSESSRYLFRNIDFMQSFTSKRYFNITNQLFEILADNCNDDFKSAVSWISCFVKKTDENKIDLVVHQYPIMVDLPIEDFLHLDWDSLVHFLSLSENICNLYQCFDAIFLWLHILHGDRISVPRVELSIDHIKDILDVKQDRCWDRMSKKYLEAISWKTTVGTITLVDLLIDSDDLSCTDGILFSSERSCVIEKIFSEDMKITLVSDNKIPSCVKDGKCALMIQSTLTKSLDNGVVDFSLKIEDVKDENEGGEDVHYHDVQGETEIVGLLMGMNSDDTSRVTPIPFNVAPCCTMSSGIWHWGFHRHQSQDESTCRFCHFYKKNSEIDFIVCLNY